MTGNMIGRVFNNRYQITERIGIGGMAEVYRAQDNVLGRLVAVKVMLPQYAADESFTQRFKQEAASAANLQSPYIVNVYDWGQDEGTYYIVMEYVRGSDLKTAINQRGAINQRKVAEIGSQVCQALSVAHGLDIIHRDIKPQNIMVQPDGNVKVMDFGIARAKNSTKEQTSSVLGTAHYISPEQAQGKELTAASDIVLYESATGKLPFDGPDAVSVAMKQVQDEPVPPRELNPEIDPSLEAIILKAMSKNPMERFATAKDMRSALNDYLAGRPVALGAGFTGAQTQIMGGVPNIGPIPDGTAVMPAVGGANQHGGSSQNHSYMSDNTAPKKKGKKVAAVVAAVAAVVALIAIAAFALGGNSGSGEQIEVPDVTGQTLDQAKSAIQSAGFKVGNVTQSYSDSVDSGKVISQDPAAKAKKAKGSTINLTVSQGSQEIEVPDLVGKTADEAKKLLQANGLKYKAGTPGCRRRFQGRQGHRGHLLPVARLRGHQRARRRRPDPQQRHRDPEQRRLLRHRRSAVLRYRRRGRRHQPDPVQRQQAQGRGHREHRGVEGQGEQGRERAQRRRPVRGQRHDHAQQRRLQGDHRVPGQQLRLLGQRHQPDAHQRHRARSRQDRAPGHQHGFRQLLWRRLRLRRHERRRLRLRWLYQRWQRLLL